jgi:hypothetical protein
VRSTLLVAPEPAHVIINGTKESKMADSITAHPNDAKYIIEHLSTSPQSQLNGFDEWIAFLSTPFKRLGISGWTQTGCSGSGYGKPVRDAQWSTDGFFTIDVLIQTLAIASRKETVTMLQTANPRYIRLEVEPGTRAHSVCTQNRPTAQDIIGFSGVVLVDRDGPFYEIHPSRLWFYVP